MARVHVMRWLTQWWCGIWSHAWMKHITVGRIYLSCERCGAESDGWRVK